MHEHTLTYGMRAHNESIQLRERERERIVLASTCNHVPMILGCFSETRCVGALDDKLHVCRQQIYRVSPPVQIHLWIILDLVLM